MECLQKSQRKRSLPSEFPSTHGTQPKIVRSMQSNMLRSSIHRSLKRMSYRISQMPTSALVYLILPDKITTTLHTRSSFRRRRYMCWYGTWDMRTLQSRKSLSSMKTMMANSNGLIATKRLRTSRIEGTNRSPRRPSMMTLIARFNTGLTACGPPSRELRFSLSLLTPTVLMMIILVELSKLDVDANA